MPDLSDLVLEPPANLAVLLAERAITYGWCDRTAFRYGDGELTHGQVHNAAGRAAGVLAAAGVRKGTRLLIALPDSPALISALLAAFHLGAVAITVSPHVSEDEHEHVLEDADPWLVICEPALAGRFGAVLVPEDLDRHARTPPAAMVSPQSPAYVQYTSGTTGRPKGVVHRHGDPLAYCQAFGRALEVGRDDVLFSASKACYPWGFGTTFFFTLYFGASAVLWPDRASGLGVAEQIEKHAPTLLFTTPPLYAKLAGLDRAIDAASLRAAYTAGEPLLPALRDRVERLLGCALLDGLGTTEAGHTFIANTVRRSRPGTLGIPLPPYEISIRKTDGREARIGEIGSLHVRGPSIMEGYLGRPELTRRVLDAQGWLATGDLVHRDRAGFVHHHGRAEDMEIVQGVRIAPAEMERALGAHQAAAEVAVVGGSQGLKAFVVPAPGFPPGPSLEASLLRRAPAMLREVVFLPDLPRTPSGKIRRAVLKSL